MEKMDILKVLDTLLCVSDNQIKSLELVFEQFLSQVDEPANKFLHKLSSCSGNSDMLDLVKEYFQWTPLDPTIRSKYEKNSGISTAFRNLGNAAFQKKSYVDALRSYNLSVMFAVDGESQLGLSYANRSAALHSMGLTEEALKDINLALSNGYPKDDEVMLKKLEDRRSRFESHLKERLKNSTLEAQLKDDISKRNAFHQDLFTLKSSNPMAPALDESVSIKVDPIRGRQIVANRDIPIGTTILVERPFVSALKNALNWDVEHCHHCLKKNFRCIPCPKCVFTQYCDEKCRTEAQSYHQYECPCLPELHCILNDDMGKGNLHLAFKVICIMGPTKLFALFKQRKSRDHVVDFESTGIAGQDPVTGLYESNAYRTVYNLMTSKTPKEGYYLFLLALTLTHTLDSNSHYFDFLPNKGEKQAFQDFIAELIIHHFETFRRNVYAVEEIQGLDGVTLRTYMETNKPKGRLDIDLKPFAGGAFATASLINHSCNQNVMRFFGKTYGTTAIIALKPLRKGEELLISYGPLYGSLRPQDESAASRQAVLNEKYEFLCNCVACTYDLPGYREMKMGNLTTGLRGKPVFCCPLCSSKVPHENRMSDDFSKCKLTSGFKCRICNSQHSQQKIEKEYVHHCMALEFCMKSVLSDIVSSSSLQTMSTLKLALQFFETHVCPPNYQSLDGSLLYRDNVKFLIFFSDLAV